MHLFGVILCCSAAALWLIGVGVIWPIYRRRRILSDPEISSIRKLLWFWQLPSPKEGLWLLSLTLVVCVLLYLGGLFTGEITISSLTMRSTRTQPQAAGSCH